MVRIYFELSALSASAAQNCQPFRRDLAAAVFARGGGPANFCETHDTARRDRQTLGGQQGALQRQARITAKFPVGGDHPMVGQARTRRLPQDVAHRARRAGAARQARPVALRRDAAGGNARDHREHSPLERRHRPMVIFRRKLVPPRSVSLNTSDTPDVPMASATVVQATSPPTAIQRATRYSAPPSR